MLHVVPCSCARIFNPSSDFIRYLAFYPRYYMQSPTTSRAVTRALDGAMRVFGSPSVSRKIITKAILQSLIALILKPNITLVVFRTVWRIVMGFLWFTTF